jgi:hypothetical protein
LGNNIEGLPGTRLAKGAIRIGKHPRRRFTIGRLGRQLALQASERSEAKPWGNIR